MNCIADPIGEVIVKILIPVTALNATGAAIEARSESPTAQVAGRILQMVPAAFWSFVADSSHFHGSLVGASAVLFAPLLIHGAKKITEICNLPRAKTALNIIEKVLMVAVKIANLALNIFLLYAAVCESCFLIAGVFLAILAVNLHSCLFSSTRPMLPNS